MHFSEKVLRNGLGTLDNGVQFIPQGTGTAVVGTLVKYKYNGNPHGARLFDVSDGTNTAHIGVEVTSLDGTDLQDADGTSVSGHHVVTYMGTLYHVAAKKDP
jgi:hypothetical protein